MTEIVELIIDEEENEFGVDAISLVSEPAIQENFLAFKNQEKSKFTFAVADKERRILIGPALIPNKQIFRYDQETGKEYYVWFSKDTVRKASQLFLQNDKQHNHTLEHEKNIDGLTVVESWIKDSPIDKSEAFGFKVPVGSWMVAIKVNDDAIWKEQVKSGKTKGFSIEGFFVNKMEYVKNKRKKKKKKYDKAPRKMGAVRKNSECPDGFEHQMKDGKWMCGKTHYDEIYFDHEYNFSEEEMRELHDNGVLYTTQIDQDGTEMTIKFTYKRDVNMLEDNPCQSGYVAYGTKIKNGKKVPNCIPLESEEHKLASYNDYPEGAVNNAKRALAYVEENGWGDCGEATGKKRANMLANKEPLSRDTIARMASFKRHQQNKDVPYSEGCGGLMWDSWGGSSGVNWAISKLKEIDEERLCEQIKDIIKE